MEKTYTVHQLASGIHYIMVDDETARSILVEGNRRAKCVLNNKVTIHCALMPRKGGGHYINLGQTTCRKLQIKAGDTLIAQFEIDNSPMQFEMPEALQAVLDTDPEAQKIFEQLTPGNQRGLAYLVNQVKSTDKQVDRALKVVEQIKSGTTSPKKIKFNR